VAGWTGSCAARPHEAALATPGWRVTIVLAEQADGWEIVEVGNVYP
jgi:hypothetical protein